MAVTSHNKSQNFLKVQTNQKKLSHCETLLTFYFAKLFPGLQVGLNP